MEELEQQLINVLQKAIEVAEQTGEFAIEQAPLLLQEFYMWHITESILSILLGIFLIITPYILYRIFRKPIDTYDSYDDVKVGEKYCMMMPLAITGMLVSTVSIVCGIVIIFDNISRLLKIIISPKLYLIEYFIN